jgi:hypothetical protein
MVVRTTKDNREVLYIPHALEVWGIFTSFEALRKKLRESDLYSPIYIFPTDDFFELALEYGSHGFWSSGSWQEIKDPKGIYYTLKDFG